MPCRSCRGYTERSIEAHGFAPTLLADAWRDDDAAAWPELDELGLDELAEVQLDGLPLGAAIDVPAKWFLLRARLDGDPLGPFTVRQFLVAARRVAAGFAAGLDRHRPDVVVMLNGLFFFEAVASALCRRRGIDVVTYERGFRPGTVFASRGEPASRYEIGAAWAAVADEPLSTAQDAELDRYLAERRRTGHPIFDFWGEARHETPQKGEGRLACLFTNVTWDSAVIGREGAFPSIQAWLDAAVAVAEARPADQLVIRIHPAEVRMSGKVTREPLADHLVQRAGRLPPNVRVIPPEDPVSSYDLLDACDVGLVLTSTVGLEAALAGKPVMVAGTPHYRGKGFTVDVDTVRGFQEQAGRLLDDPASLSVDVPRARRYAHAFFFDVPIEFPWVSEPVPGLARLHVDHPDQLGPGAHADLDRLCDGILEGDVTLGGPPG